MELVTAENFKAPKKWQHFYQHLMQNRRILPIGVGDPTLLARTGRDVLQAIESGEGGWEDWVPEEARPMIRRRKIVKHK